MKNINSNQNCFKSVIGSAANGTLTDMTLTELQEIALRQQQQIEINQQLLLAKEKRLKMLKLEEQKNQQLALLTNSSCNGANLNRTIENAHKLENLKQNVLSQELKIFKLKELRNQILKHKLSNSNMNSELDLIKSLFSKKERELCDAIKSVAELSKQIEQLRKIKSFSFGHGLVSMVNNNNEFNQQSQGGTIGKTNNGTLINNSSISASELEKLKQELQIRNKLNEQQAKKIMQQHELFNQKQTEVLALDKRIEELQGRISSKRSMTSGEQSVCFTQQKQLNDTTFSEEANNNQTTNGTGLNQTCNLNLLGVNGSGSSPSKVIPKFATKQEIANTYMNKFGGSEAYHRFQMNSIKMLQQQQQNGEQTQFVMSSSLLAGGAAGHAKQSSQSSGSDEAGSTSTNTDSLNNAMSIMGGTGGCGMSSLDSVPIANEKKLQDLLSNQLEQQLNKSNNNPNAENINNNNNNISSGALPSHLKLEFDKLKYLPDMIKTIKKRHSISEIESSSGSIGMGGTIGSSHMIPPQIFQKILDKHHKNFFDMNQSNSSNQSNNGNNNNINNQLKSKLNQIKETNENQQLSKQNLDAEVKKQQSEDLEQKTIGLSSPPSPPHPTEEDEKFIEKSISVRNEVNTASSFAITGGAIESAPVPVKSTKPIIKVAASLSSAAVSGTESSSMADTEAGGAETISASKRVNFDPHALLLDAAVEGELDLVMKCAKQVNDISEPNDEGITALHNSVCAGHFEIVKFLVEYGCDINYADNDGWTPLHCAASCNNLPMVKFLIEHGASVYATTLSDNETAIKKCEEDEEGFEPCYEYLSSVLKNLGDRGVNNAIVHALYSYEAQNEDELSFNCFDKLVIIEKHEDEENGDANDGWWTAKHLLDDTKTGLVPNNYIGLFPRVSHLGSKTHHQESTVC